MTTEAQPHNQHTEKERTSSPVVEASPPRADTAVNDRNEEEDSYPEGGLRAWLVVLGAWCAMVPSMGLLNTMGVLNAWVAEHQLKTYPESTVGWIFSLYAFFLYVSGVKVGSIFDTYGVKPLLIPGSIGITAAVMCLSLSTKYYQFLLSFGVLGGVSSCLLFNPAVSVVGHWFCKRRAYATGIALTAGGSGGIMFPLIILYLAPRIGFPWAIRVIGFICGGLCVVACLLLRTRLPLNKNAGAGIDLKALKDSKYAATTVAVFLVEFAVFIPLTYISSYAIHVGVDSQHAYLLNALLNTGSVFGRFIPGYVADRFGRFNVMSVTSLVCSLFIFALWLPCGDNETAITAFAVLFGFWSGAAISLTPVCIAQVCRIEDYGKRNGTAFSISSIGSLIGIPIAGAILNTGAGYVGLICFGGAMYLAATLAFIIARGIAGGCSLTKVF